MAQYGAQLMAARRTTLILDEESRVAARQLADHYGCHVSEAIRRSLIAQRDSVAGVPKRIRQQRVRILKRLFEIFEGNDAAEEVRRLKMEDQGF
jgi:Trm5-related predicted tRNA methylase